MDAQMANDHILAEGLTDDDTRSDRIALVASQSI
ncbi:hypothetical protein J2S89_001199 [Arthrobacter bambusae]|nr:hypothetical protein [Arthrobacter bambusae]MDQ0097038.1 hypothetical protein [Arthrobacter bambusae]